MSHYVCRKGGLTYELYFQYMMTNFIFVVKDAWLGVSNRTRVSYKIFWNGRWTVFRWHLCFLVFECSCIWCSAWGFCVTAAFSLVMAGWPPYCILVGWSSLCVAFPRCCPRLYNCNSNFSLWRFVSCFSPHIFFSILSSLLFLICLHSFISLFLISITPTPLPVHMPCPLPPWQTYPITRTITIKAKLWIKRMISPQWPMPWQGWVPLRLSQPCPAAQDPLPACMTASCSAQAAKRPSRDWRWILESKLYSYSSIICVLSDHMQINLQYH